MTGKGNQVTPTSTTLQARVALFQPRRRPYQLSGGWVETAHGRCRVQGRLGQRHADLLESMLYVAERRREISDGGVEMLVDPAAVRRTLSKQYSYEGIQDLMADLRSVSVEIVTPEMQNTGERIIGGIIDHAIPSQMTRRDPLTGEDRHMWRVRLGVALVMLLNNDLSLYYEPTPIAHLRHGISQAVARYVLTHKQVPPGGWHVDTLIRAVWGDKARSQDVRNGRRRLNEDMEGLRQVGIEITEEKRVKRG